jgi:hypothetical protein
MPFHSAESYVAACAPARTRVDTTAQRITFLFIGVPVRIASHHTVSVEWEARLATPLKVALVRCNL